MEIGSKGRLLRLDAKSTPAEDGSFLTPVLDPDHYYFHVPAGAPGFVILKTLYVDPRAGVLSTIDRASHHDVPNFRKVSHFENGAEIYQPDLRGAHERLVRAARAMIWLAIEDDPNDRHLACTGFLITPDLALTNDHCARPTMTNHPGKPGLVRAWLRAESRDRKEAPSFHRGDLAYLSRVPEADPKIRLDFTVLRLAKTAPNALPLKLAYEAPPDGRPLAVLQFPKNEPLVVNHDGDCTVWGQGAGYLIHGCDTDRGSSGSPVIDRDLSGGVYALHFLGHDNDETMGNRALPIPALLEEISTHNKKLYEEILKLQEGLR